MSKQEYGSAVSYTVGFGLALALTLVAYFAVANSWFVGTSVVAFIILLASVQLIVQLYFFLHLGREPKPRWKSATFLFMLMVLIILVVGSLWIMANLNYNMSPDRMEQSLLKDEGIKL